MGVTRWLALAWGFAEAMLFFIVPDMLLTWIAVRHGWRRAALAALFAAAGAAAGGTLMFAWGAASPSSVHGALDALPAISPAMIDSVRADLERDGLRAMFTGAFTGVPYKVYAAEAGVAACDPAAFLLLTAPARLLRFLAACLLATALATGVARILSERAVMPLWAAFWTLFYFGYFSLMPN